MRIFFSTLFTLTILLFSINLFGAENTRHPVRFDSDSVITIRHPNAEKLADFAKNRDFIYGPNPQAVSLTDRIEYWVWEHFIKFLFLRRYAVIRKIIFYVFIAVVFAYIIFRLQHATLNGTFYTSKNRAALAFQENPENIRSLDFSKEITDAESAKKFRLAIRLLFLRSLKHLEHQQFVKWRPEKTNREYLAELSGNHIQADFREIVTIYEYAWYGNFKINRSLYRQISDIFRQFDQHLEKRS